jgi:hypothetical protein
MVAIFGNVREARGEPCARRGPTDVTLANANPAAVRDEAGDCKRELALPVAVDAGDTDELARAHAQRRFVELAADANALEHEHIACVGFARSAPTIARAISATSKGLANVAVVSPARSTVTSSATARTSSSLCVTITIVVPSLASLRSVASKPSTSIGVSTAVGSSSTSSFAP